MKAFKLKYLLTGTIILLLAGFGYYYRADLSQLLRRAQTQVQPCQKPITYSIASVDPRFGLSQAQLLVYIERAAKIWETPIGKQLFVYSPTGDLKINLVYDDRQKATDALKKIGLVLNDDQASYNALKIKHDQLLVAYNKDKANLDAMVAAYNADKVAYENEVASWNAKGGAPPPVYNDLTARRNVLNAQLATIDVSRTAFNASVDTLNSTAVVLNKLIASLNLQVTKYNTIGASNGQQFSEGVYTSDANGTAIDIFQFNNTDQLVRLFAHEFGHALGLEHLANPKAIMYYLNEGMNEKLTTDDLAALKALCHLK